MRGRVRVRVRGGYLEAVGDAARDDHEQKDKALDEENRVEQQRVDHLDVEHRHREEEQRGKGQTPNEGREATGVVCREEARPLAPVADQDEADALDKRAYQRHEDRLRR